MSHLDLADPPAASHLLAVAAAGQFDSPAAPLLVGVGLSRFGLAVWLAVLMLPLAAGMFLLPELRAPRRAAPVCSGVEASPTLAVCMISRKARGRTSVEHFVTSSYSGTVAS